MKKATQKRPYHKPILKKEETMKFPQELIEAGRPKVACRQCSSCHGCR